MGSTHLFVVPDLNPGSSPCTKVTFMVLLALVVLGRIDSQSRVIVLPESKRAFTRQPSSLIWILELLCQGYVQHSL